MEDIYFIEISKENNNVITNLKWNKLQGISQKPGAKQWE